MTTQSGASALNTMPADIALDSWLARRADRTPGRLALTFRDRTYTYAELAHRVEVMAGVFRAEGVTRGDRVAFLGWNQPELIEAYFACSRLGVILVPLNFRLTGPELAFIIEDASAKVLLADLRHQPVIDGVRSQLSVDSFIGVDGAGSGGWVAFQDLASRAEPVVEGAAVHGDDVAALMYTSGTTGRPKGAMLTHANLWWNNINVLHAIDILSDDVTLTVMPIFHIGGLNVLTLLTLQKGGHVVLHETFEPDAALRAIADHGVTTLIAVPAMLLAMSIEPSFASADLSSLRSLLCGGAPSPEPLLRTWTERGIPVLQAYGLTETACIVSMLAPEHALDRLGSSGQPVLLMDVRLVSDAGDEVTTPFDRGELCVRGPNVTPGYWNLPDASAQAFDADGWFRTGDVAYADDAGFLYVVDRVNDMVISGGENIYPAEVESVLHDHPAVHEAAIIGLPDERWGETPVAVVALRAGATLTLDELRDFAGHSLARYKLPTRLEIVDALPRTATGKILKAKIRADLHPVDKATEERHHVR